MATTRFDYSHETRDDRRFVVLHNPDRDQSAWSALGEIAEFKRTGNMVPGGMGRLLWAVRFSSDARE
jgi:hypothetical protein